MLLITELRRQRQLNHCEFKPSLCSTKEVLGEPSQHRVILFGEEKNIYTYHIILYIYVYIYIKNKYIINKIYKYIKNRYMLRKLCIFNIYFSKYIFIPNQYYS